MIALRIAEELRRRSRAVRVWVPGDGAAMREARRLGLDVAPYSAALLSSDRSRWETVVGNLRLFRELSWAGRGLVHVHSPYVYRALVPSLQLSGMPSVVHVQIEDETEGLRWAFRRPPDLTITCARFLMDRVRQALPPPRREQQRIETLPNAVDIRKFVPGDKRAAKHKVGAPADIPLILMLANLAPHKGQETAIRAVASLKQQGIPVVCWLAGVERGGSKSYSQRLQSLIGALDLGDRVQLLGQRADADELLRAADFFLLPSTNEGLPLSILEAQATKVPVLAAPTAGIPEVVSDGETGFLIPASDAQGYADRLRSLLQDSAEYRRVAEQAYTRTISELSWGPHCEHLLSLYDSLTNRDGVRRSRRATRSRVTT